MHFWKKGSELDEVKIYSNMMFDLCVTCECVSVHTV